MDIERSLVTKIVASGQIDTVITKGISADHFVDDECRAMYLLLLDYVRKYKSTPSMQMLKGKTKNHKVLKNFEWHHVQDPLEALCDEFINIIQRRLANESVIELAEMLNDPERRTNVVGEFMEVSRQLALVVPSTRVENFRDMDKRIDEYERQAAEGEKLGIQFGFPALDAATGGIQPHEFVVVAGFSGLGKSTLLLKIAHNAYMQGKVPMYVSLEMEAKAIMRRFDAMTAALSYQNLKDLNLPEEELENWRATAAWVKEANQHIPVIDSLRGCNPDHVFMETVRHKPDLVVIDYLGLMRTARPNQKSNSLWQSLTEITQDLKQNARTLGIPILAAAQTNRSGAREGSELDNIGGSISVSQDADIVIGLYADEEMKERKEMEIRLNKNRDGRLTRFTAIWDHDKQDYRERGMADLFARKTNEQTSMETKFKKKQNKTNENLFIKADKENKV